MTKNKPKKENWEIIAHEYVVSLFPVFLLVDGAGAGMAKIKGSGVDLALQITNRSLTWYNLPSNWGKVHRFLVSKIKDNPDFLRNIFKVIDRDGGKQVEFTKKLASVDSKKLTNQQLNSNYQKYCQLNTSLYSYGLVLPLLDFQQTTFLTDEVNKFLKQKQAAQYFNILTTPLQDTFNRIQEISLLRILDQIKKNQRVFNLFKNLGSQQLVAILSKEFKEIWRQIRNHTRKFAWVYYVYEGPAADEVYFIDFLRDLIQRKINPKTELINQGNEKKKLEEEQRLILNKLRPNNYYRAILQLARDAVYFKAYRRDLQTASYYYMEPVLAEIGRRLGLSLKQVRMLLPEEVKAGLLLGKINLSEINQRLKLVVYFRKGKLRKVLSGKKTINFLQGVKAEKIVNKNVKEIKGTIAQAGRARGLVKLINSPEDMAKMKVGDILVSFATNPNLMPAIRKAAAIVTDEGGLTCHAAIVSRELKIPCVVGTGFATKILKDGDKIEVDATKGIVKKVK